MKKFADLTAEDQNRLDAYLNGTIEPEDFAKLETRMAEDAELRAAFRRYAALDDSLRHTAGESEGTAWLELASPKEESKVVSFSIYKVFYLR